MARIPFPQRLFQLLKLVEENGWEDIISWVDDGKRFKVHDREKFEKVLLDKHFNTTRYASFTRQLHAYGFDCVRTGRQTGIYSHPSFTKSDSKTSSALKRRVGNNISKTSMSKFTKQERQDKELGDRFGGKIRKGILAGGTFVKFPSLLETPLSERNDCDHSSVMANLFNTVRSQVASRTREALVRLPPGAMTKDLPFHMETGGFWSAASADPPSMNASSRLHIVEDVPKPCEVSSKVGNITIRHFELDTAALKSPMEDDIEEWDPIPLSPMEILSDEDESSETMNQLDSSLEPRQINEIVENPNSLNEWLYDSVPMFDSPRKRAILELSAPLSLPVGFYLLDVSTYGICWVTILILGHLVECLFTSWGGARDEEDNTYTKDLSFKPTIGMLQHHIMDLLWFHSLVSNMILTPDYFGKGCFSLLYLFIWPQPFNLCISLKTHYSESNLEGTYDHSKWWMGDLIKHVLLGYAVTLLGVFLLHYCDMTFLRIPLVFGFNMIPLFAFESYRYLLSVPTILEQGVSSHKKKIS